MNGMSPMSGAKPLDSNVVNQKALVEYQLDTIQPDGLS